MMQSDQYQPLLDGLKSAVGLLELTPSSSLWRDVATVCDRPTQSAFRIAVFGPFNYGKSTLLNAILGERALPIDLIPTTGAAITVRYGDTLHTKIQLTDGTTVNEAGTEVLKRYAILDESRRMRDNVTSVEVFCPHPWLKTGVELLDLPGTDDQQAQDALVKDQLLTADLVVQLLDGRKLMTLGEREHLRDWLLDRGIETVVFVVNFLNLLEPEDQKQVYNRLRFVAESFRATLPTGISNLYRVDALPALRARLKGDMAAAQTAGLPMFESALQTIVVAHQGTNTVRIPRIQAIASQVQQALQQRMTSLQSELEAANNKRQQKIQIKQQAADLINKGFLKSLTECTEWLSLANLLHCYQQEVATALQQEQFPVWERGEFRKTAIDHQQAVVKWVHQACEFFDRERPNQLLIGFPPHPKVILPDPSAPPRSPKAGEDVAPVAIATGLGWMLGGPVGGAILGGASYLLNKTRDSDKPTEDAPVKDVQLTYTYFDAAREYLIHFSTLNLTALHRYQQSALHVLNYDATQETTTITPQHHQLNLLTTTLERLKQQSHLL